MFRTAAIKGSTMPELPEVETVRRGLEPILVGNAFARVEQRRPDLRFPAAEALRREAVGAKDRVARPARQIFACPARRRRGAGDASRHDRALLGRPERCSSAHSRMKRAQRRSMSISSSISATAPRCIIPMRAASAIWISFRPRGSINTPCSRASASSRSAQPLPPNGSPSGSRARPPRSRPRWSIRD